MVAIEGRNTRTSSSPRARRGLAARLVWPIAAIGIVDVVILGWAYTREPSSTPLDWVSGIGLLLSLAAFVLSGAVIVSRQPGNVIGWLLMIPGLALPLAELSLRWLGRLEPPPTVVGPGLWVLLWASGVAWVALIFPIFHILLTFPTGRLLSPRWRAAVALELVMIATIAGLAAFSAEMGPLVDDEVVWSVPNPIGFVPADSSDGLFGTVWSLGLVTLCVLGAGALVLRFRRGSRDERQQLKWPMAGALAFGITYAGSALNFSWEGALFAVGITAIPLSVAIAITRYHLYDLGRIVGRTVAYGLITAVLAAAFLASNVALQAVFDRETTFEVAVSTLVVALLFQPLRRAIQRPIDRRFNRARVDAERMVAAFSARTRNQMDLPALTTDLSATATSAMQPSSITIWLRGRGDAGPR